MSQEEPRKALIVIAGPTAVGKTALAISLAQKLSTEIVSADSRQFFREMTIGTAKPSAAELGLVPHHFIDTMSIDQEYDAAQFGEDATKVIQEILSRRKYAIMCGGSGLYIQAVTTGFDEIPEVDPQIRVDLIKNFEQFGIEWLQQKMEENDPELLQELDRMNPHRLIRALEIRIGTGASIKSFRNQKKNVHDFDVIMIGLNIARDELYARIDRRMDDMIRQGLFDEAAQLYPFREHQALQTVGYQEIFGFMDGLYDRDEAIRLLKRNSRRYAKRQLTWFKRDPNMKWFHPSEIDNIVEWVESFGQSNSSDS